MRFSSLRSCLTQRTSLCRRVWPRKSRLRRAGGTTTSPRRQIRRLPMSRRKRWTGSDVIGFSSWVCVGGYIVTPSQRHTVVNVSKMKIYDACHVLCRVLSCTRPVGSQALHFRRRFATANLLVVHAVDPRGTCSGVRRRGMTACRFV